MVEHTDFEKLKKYHQALVAQAIHKAHEVAKSLMNEKNRAMQQRSIVVNQFDDIRKGKKDLLELKRVGRHAHSNAIKNDVNLLEKDIDHIMDEDKKLRTLIIEEIRSLNADVNELQNLATKIEHGRTRTFSHEELTAMSNEIKKVHSRMQWRQKVENLEFQLMNKIQGWTDKENALFEKIQTETRQGTAQRRLRRKRLTRPSRGYR